MYTSSAANEKSHPYFHFLIAKSSQRTLSQLDPIAEKLLEFIALENFKGTRLTMMMALDFSKNLTLTQSTLARRIKLLQQMKLINVRICETDRRMKILHLSARASRHFNELSKMITQADLAKPDSI